MSHSHIIGNEQQLQVRRKALSVAVEQGMRPDAGSSLRRRPIVDRFVYGLAITLIVAPFVLMFVAAPIAVALILLTGPSLDTGISPEASALHRLQHAPWSTTGLRRRP